MARPRLEVAEVVRRYGPAYRAAHACSRSQQRVLRAIATCRTAALGGHLEACDACGYERPAYNSCANRHCPKCQALARARWLAARQAELLDVELCARPRNVVFQSRGSDSGGQARREHDITG